MTRYSLEKENLLTLRTGAPAGHSGSLTTSVVVEHFALHDVQLLLNTDEESSAAQWQKAGRFESRHSLSVVQADNLVAGPVWRLSVRAQEKAVRLLGIFETSPLKCVVSPASRVRSTNQLCELIKGKGSVTIASAGHGSVSHLAALLMLRALGLPEYDVGVKHVALRSDGKAVAAVLKSTADFTCVAAPAVHTLILEGRVCSLPMPAALRGFHTFTGLAGSTHVSESAAAVWHGRLESLRDSRQVSRRLADYGSLLSVMDANTARSFVANQQSLLSALVSQYRLER